MTVDNIYDKNLQWIKRVDEFERDQKAIILACSRKNHKWSSYSAIEKQSGLIQKKLYKELSYLLEANVLKIAFDDKMNPVFALRERIEK